MHRIGSCLLRHNSNAPEQNHPYSSMHSQHCIALRFCDKWWSFRASTETSFNRHWDTSIHHHSSIDGNPMTDYTQVQTNNKNDLLESSDSDSVSDLCRTFLQEVYDTLITLPNWNTTTTYRWLMIVAVASEMSRFCCCYLLVLLADMRNCSTIILSSVCQLDWEPFLPSCWSSLRTGLYCWLRKLPKNVQDQESGMLNYYNEEAAKATEETKAMTSCNRRQDEMH